MKRILSFCLVFCVWGCGRSVEAEKTAALIELSAINHTRNMDRICEGFIQNYRMMAREKADSLAEAALKSITKVVNGEAVANPKNVQFILQTKAKHYAKIESNCVDMRKKILSANQDIRNIEKLSKGLKAYFNQRADFGEILNQSSEIVVEALDAFTGKKGEDDE